MCGLCTWDGLKLTKGFKGFLDLTGTGAVNVVTENIGLEEQSFIN